MGLFKNNYMFSKVTNYSFILNERKAAKEQKNIIIIINMSVIMHIVALFARSPQF